MLFAAISFTLKAIAISFDAVGIYRRIIGTMPKTMEEIYDFAGVPKNAQDYLKARGIQSPMLLARMAPDVQTLEKEPF